MRIVLMCAAVTALAGCDATWPYDRPGTWRPSGVVDANIAASVVNPSDLVRGVAYNPREGSATTAAVERYRTGTVKALPSQTTSALRAAPSGGDNGGAAPASVGTAAAAQ